MSYPCPLCSTVAARANNLRTHLKGQLKNGGHALSVANADLVIVNVEGGRVAHHNMPSELQAVRRPAQSTISSRSQTPHPSPALRAGHWRALALLEEPLRVRETLRVYEQAIGHPVFLRPTDAGLTVLSFDPALLAMVGVGGSNSGDCCITVLPPTTAQLAKSVEAYQVKVAAMVRDSPEERSVVGRIRGALEDGLKLGNNLLFLHHEWRFPSSGKIDILAIDSSCGQLVVVEAKGSRIAATTKRDKQGRTASEQAAEYAARLTSHAGEYLPYFQRLATALARVYSGDVDLRLDPSLAPRWEVWWPGGSIVGPH